MVRGGGAVAMGRLPVKFFLAIFGSQVTLFLIALAGEIDPDYPLYSTRTCQEGGRALSCDDNHVIKIHDVRYMPFNYTCSERDKISNLCDGMRFCSKIGLKRMLHYYCKNYPSEEVLTSFQCLPDKVRPICRTNVCSQESRDIRCRRGKVIHIMSADCDRNHPDCNVYPALYRTCQSQRTCSVSGIRNSLPGNTCNSSEVQRHNVFVDYICADNSIVSDKCTGTFVKLTHLFGIIQNPGYPRNPNGSSLSCYWVIYPGTGQEVDVNVHLAYSKEGRENCDSIFLQVQYTVCQTGKQQTERFCDAGRVNVNLHSCGTVYVMHWPYDAGPDRGNRFLVSYHVRDPLADEESYEKYAYQCEKRDQQAERARYTLVYPESSPPGTTETIVTTDTNKEDYILISDGTIPVSEGKAAKTTTSDVKKSDPWKMVTLLRVVVVNIFLGLLIIALIMALIFVCYRYRTFGKKKKKAITSASNTTTTLDDKNSTEMQLLSDPDENSRGSGAQPLLDTVNIPRKDRASPVLTNAVYQTVPQCEKHSHPDGEAIYYNSGKGVSSFLQNARVDTGDYPESAYSTLDPTDDLTSNDTRIKSYPRNYPENKTTVINYSQTNEHAPAEQNIRDSLQHYKINDDEYAVVMKQPRVSLKQRQYAEDPLHGNSVTNKPIAHIHPVPDDGHISHTTMHMIPQHDCLLHKHPPPPPRPAPRGNPGYWGSPEHAPGFHKARAYDATYY